MADATITTSVITGGSNSHATTSAEVNAHGTDFITQGVVGDLTNTSGVSPATGGWAVNALGTPGMAVDISGGTAYILATPSGQTSQMLRAVATATSTSHTISSNASGSTKYDWIYLKVDPTAANSSNSGATDVTALYTSRSSSNSTDNGSPPTYGIPLAIVTVANGASSITNGNITDNRTRATNIQDATAISRTLAPTLYRTAISYAQQSNGTETTKSTITIAAQPVASVVFLYASLDCDLGNGSPTLNWITRIRRTNTSGTVIAYAEQSKAAASGVTERRSMALIGIDSLAANTSQAYVLTDASNIGGSMVAGSSWGAIVLSSANATIA